ncbi:hypothetical protein AMS68_002532 [Peltaster fructicola]|uniref:Autophagy-related protein 2 n=1 Tax=Peltaster fructicola TaxID=286661 RepID=A0A6H0XQV2_9PEZI|nr:hypothetical protein AMS68_002532 [Peltaster fructicola]
MASWLPFPLPSSIQKRFLSYALSKVGVFDDASLDLDNLNLTWGRQNIVELKDVALDAAAISKKANLPPSLHVEAGKVSLLRLMVPADIHKSGIVVDAVGVRVSLRYQEEVNDQRASTHGQSPSHRKTTRRIASPSHRRMRGYDQDDEDVLPTAHDLARSFYLEEPLEDRQRLAASVAAHTANLEESVTSESSQGTEPGTGTAIGVPAFLAAFLTGVLDRVVVNIQDVRVDLDAHIPGASSRALILPFRLGVSNAKIWSAAETTATETAAPLRHVQLTGITLAVLGDPDQNTPTVRSQASLHSELDHELHADDAMVQSSTLTSQPSIAQSIVDNAVPVGHETLDSSVYTVDADRFADAHDDVPATQLADSQFDIRLGDDNISWGTRRDRQGPGTQDLWDSVADENDLPDSLLFDERHATQRSSVPSQQSSLLDQSTFEQAPQTMEGVAESRPVLSTDSQHLGMGPGSWPTRIDNRTTMLDESLQESIQSLASALEHTPTAQSIADPGHSSSPDGLFAQDDQDLDQSRHSSHDEAESMYMSAMTQDVQADRVPPAMPGAWGAESQAYDHPFATPTPQVQETSTPAEANTPRAQSPVHERRPSRSDNHDDKRIVIELIVLDEVKVTLKIAEGTSTDQHEHDSGINTIRSTVEASRSMPRKESTLSNLSDGLESSAASSNILDKSSIVTRIQCSTVQCRLDPAVLQMLLKAGMAILTARSASIVDVAPSSQQTMPDYMVEVAVQHFTLDVVRDLAPSAVDTFSLASVRFDNLSLRHRQDDSRLQLTAFALDLGGAPVLRFEPEHTSSGKLLHKPDMEFSYCNTRMDLRHRAVPEASVHTQVLILNFDLPALGRVSEYIGGLSGILEMGSTLSEHSAPASPTTNKRVGGVRFTDESVSAATPPSMKTNIRLSGVTVNLLGHSCGLALQMSSLKAVQREQGISLSTSRVDIAQSTSGNVTKNAIVAEGIRLDFLTAPTDKDLEKFLALLTPSNDKYDNDGDILIETLIRQRKKGACLRVQVDMVRATIEEHSKVALLATLGTDLGQFSAVTKYLPDDDRPGLLSMIRIKELEARGPTNASFGDIKVRAEELQCAHVGLPALLAVALSNFSITSAADELLVHQLLPYQGGDNLPMIMIRTLADELEPNVQVKLFNLCAEYSVPTLLGLMGTMTHVDTDNIAADLLNSVADLALSTYMGQASEIDSSPPAKPVEKKTRIDISIHNSAIGLTPLQLKSKALVVLTDSRLSMLIPPAQQTQISFELKRGAIYVTDDASNNDEDQTVARRSSTNTATDARLADALWRRGYASAASIMSAKVDIHITEATAELARMTRVEIRNELILMETCADSTQTFMTTFGALSPPTAPSKQPKYQLEPLTLEDMISSFTGQTVDAGTRSPDTLFDFENEPALSEAMQNSMIDDILDDDLLIESEMTSSLYGPVSGLLGDLDESQEDNRPPAEAAESLLEEDPFVMTVVPDDIPFGDSTLAKDLRSQARQRATSSPVELIPMEIDDLGYDALGTDAHVLGNAHRFTGPVPARGRASSEARKCPVSVKLRDVHFLWNLHDGYDWQRTRDGISSAVERVEQRAEERLARRRQSRNQVEDDESVIGDCLFNSIYIGVPSTQEAQDIRRQINRHIDDLASETESVPYSAMSRPTAYSSSGRATHRPRRRLKLERSRSHKIAFELKGVSMDFSLFAPDEAELQSSVDFRAHSLEIFDNVPTSTWRKFLTLLRTEGGREMSKPMIHLELDNVKTIQNFAATEMVVKVTLLPLRLHVDQDALDFITRFFEFKDDSKPTSDTPTDQPFLQRVEVNTVDLQLDYKPKKIDYAGLRSGHTTEFMNFIVLDAANIRLKHAIVYGIKGFEPLHKTLNDVWMPDVRRNQLPTVLAGLAPVRSLVNIGTGIRDVVAIPVREYRKDGRVVRSISKGAFHFGKTTASELARLGAKVAIGTQNILSGAEELLGPSSASPTGRPSPSHRVSSDYGWHEVEEDDGDGERRATSAYADQPLGVLAGLRSARRYLEHDLLTAKDALIAVQGEVLTSNTPGAAAAAVARHAPTVIFRPVIGASRAVGTALLGVGNQIDRDNLRKMEDKYKRY